MQLIDYAKRGDTDPKAMRMADFWLTVSLWPKSNKSLAGEGGGALGAPQAGQ